MCARSACVRACARAGVSPACSRARSLRARCSSHACARARRCSFALLLCASLALSLPSLRSYGVPFLHSHCPYGLLYFTLFLCYTLIVCIPCAFIVVKDSRWDEPRRAPFSPWGAAGAATGDEGESRCWPCHMGRSKIIYRSVKTGISFTSRLGKGAVGPDETRPALTGPSNKNGEVIPFHVCRGSE